MGLCEMSFKVITIEAFDLPDCWHKALRACLADGYEYVIQRGSFQGNKRRELDSVLIHIKRPSNRPLIPDVPEGIPPPTSMEYINSYLGYLFTPDKKPEEDYTYGERISQQLDEVIQILKETPDTNQACISISQPSDIFLKDPPCMRSLDLRVRYNQLHFFVYFRSWDLWAGLPSNLAGLQLLKEYIAREIGVEDGTMNAWSKGLHLYDYQFEIAKITTTPRAHG